MTTNRRCRQRGGGSRLSVAAIGIGRKPGCPSPCGLAAAMMLVGCCAGLLAEEIRAVVPAKEGGKDDKVGDIIDDHCYPIPGDTKPEEKRAALFGEFGGLGYNVPGHCWNEASWSYVKYKDVESLNAAYLDLYKTLFQKVKSPGVSGAVYTQLTDIEAENNGLLTYDREVMKISQAHAPIHRGEGIASETK